jgi:hypothetical protein
MDSRAEAGKIRDALTIPVRAAVPRIFKNRLLLLRLSVKINPFIIDEALKTSRKDLKIKP